MEKYDKSELEKLIVDDKKSYSYIGKIYGVSGNAIKKAARRLGIQLPKRRTINEKEVFSHKGKRKNSLVNSVSESFFIDIIDTSNSWKEIGEKLGYKGNISTNVKKSIEDRCSELGVSLSFDTNDDILNKTKGELFSDRKNWQSARSSIQKLAREIFKYYNEKPKCAVCGYSNHVEVAHIKAVSEFDDNTTIKEINSIDNIIGLCPNHHWEYDNGILKL